MAQDGPGKHTRSADVSWEDVAETMGHARFSAVDCSRQCRIVARAFTGGFASCPQQLCEQFRVRQAKKREAHRPNDVVFAAKIPPEEAARATKRTRDKSEEPKPKRSKRVAAWGKLTNSAEEAEMAPLESILSELEAVLV
jgi:hypothetical protein